MSSADLAGRSAKERREGLVAVNDQARVREGDRAIFHLLDQQAVGAVCIRDGVNMLAERPTHDECVDFPAANDFERFLRLAKLGTQVLDFGVGELGKSSRHPPSADCQPPGGLVAPGRGARLSPISTFSVLERSPMMRRKGWGRTLSNVGTAMICSFWHASGCR